MADHLAGRVRRPGRPRSCRRGSAPGARARARSAGAAPRASAAVSVSSALRASRSSLVVLSSSTVAWSSSLSVSSSSFVAWSSSLSVSTSSVAAWTSSFATISSSLVRPQHRVRVGQLLVGVRARSRLLRVIALDPAPRGRAVLAPAVDLASRGPRRSRTLSEHVDDGDHHRRDLVAGRPAPGLEGELRHGSCRRPRRCSIGSGTGRPRPARRAMAAATAGPELVAAAARCARWMKSAPSAVP